MVYYLRLKDPFTSCNVVDVFFFVKMKPVTGSIHCHLTALVTNAGPPAVLFFHMLPDRSGGFFQT